MHKKHGIRYGADRGWASKTAEIVSLLLSIVALVLVGFAVLSFIPLDRLFDWRGVLIVVVGTVGSTLFQYKIQTWMHTAGLFTSSLIRQTDLENDFAINQLDTAILNDATLGEIREASELNGDIINDASYMQKNGLLNEEIEEYLVAKLDEELARRRKCIEMVERAARIAPALGLFGTVLGLVGVLRSLSSPDQIGPAMSLALMTTVYGAGLASLILTPIAGRLASQNNQFEDSFGSILSKIRILLLREERKTSAKEIHPPLSATGTEN